MNTRTRKTTVESSTESPTYLFDESDDSLDLEHLSDTELEEMLFEDDAAGNKTGIFNLPTLAGLSLILVGVGYIFQQMGLWSGIDFSLLASMLPVLAGILIILLGFGVLTWSPSRKKRTGDKSSSRSVRSKAKRKAASKARAAQPEAAVEGKRRLVKSRDKKISGVCAGIAEYFSLDPTLVRIAFVIGTIASGGPFVLAYILLAIILPGPTTPAKLSKEERIRIIRDS